jgi:hypothetical protein
MSGVPSAGWREVYSWCHVESECHQDVEDYRDRHQDGPGPLPGGGG